MKEIFPLIITLGVIIFTIILAFILKVEMPWDETELEKALKDPNRPSTLDFDSPDEWLKAYKRGLKN